MMQSDIIKKEPFTPRMALVVYGNGNNYYLETHTVDFKHKKPVFGPGFPLMEDTLGSIVGTISKDFVIHHDGFELLPYNILFNQQTPGRMNIIWYFEKPKKKLIFSSEMKMPKKEIIIPNMVFQYANSVLSVFCYDKEGRPNAGTKMLHSPFPNVNIMGGVCLGSAHVDTKTTSLSTFMRSAEKAFFDSRFTHSSANIKGSFRETWKMAYKAGEFPVDQLKESHYSLADLVARRNYEK